MQIKYKLKKHLSYLPCRFILGVIGHSRELSPEVNPELLHAVENEFGSIEDILSAQDFLDTPESYFREMGHRSLSTVMIVLEQGGAYTDLHHLKGDAIKVEEQFLDPPNGRIFNINPGAVGTYGLCLASHKSTGGRQDMSTYAFGFHPHLFDFFKAETYYERVMRWRDDKMVLMEMIEAENRFPEYTEASRIAKFEELVRTLPKSDVSVELMADIGSMELQS